MLAKTIKFLDLDDNEVEETFYFNLSQAEITEMELSKKGGLSAYLLGIIASEDGELIMAAFKDLICKSVGKRSMDGRRFIKNQEVVDEFVQSDAYSKFFMELVTDAGAASDFINGVVASAMKDNSLAEVKPITDVSLPEPAEQPAWVTEGRTPTPEELKNATQAQLQEAFKRQAEAKAQA